MTKFPLEDEKLQRLFCTLEQGVQSLKFTAWEVANCDFSMGAWHADEALAPNCGLKEAAAPYLAIFDLASLTKPLFTNFLLRQLVTDFEAYFVPLSTLVRDAKGDVATLFQTYLSGEGAGLRLVDIMDHTSGAKHWFWFGRGLWVFQEHLGQQKGRALAPGSSDGTLKKHVLMELVRHSFANIHTGRRHTTTYSDINYFLLARVIELLSPSLDWKTRLKNLNEAVGTQFFHTSIDVSQTAFAVPPFPYVSCERAERHEQDRLSHFGFPHDTNANILAGLGQNEAVVSGHAGLVGTVADVVKMGSALASSQVALSEKAPHSYLENLQRYKFGIDRPQDANSLSGLKNFPMPSGLEVGGHLGYAGTNMWFARDLQTKKLECHALLTNRTGCRERFDSHGVPRMLVVADNRTSEKYYFTYKKEKFEKLSGEDFYAMNQFYYQAASRFWNDRLVRPAADINDIRRTVGRDLWSL